MDIDKPKEQPAIPERGTTADLRAAIAGLRTTYTACVDFRNRPIEMESLRLQLDFVEARMPEMLARRSRWHGIKIPEEGGLLRLSFALDKLRVCLHKIPPCAEGKSVYHFHQWPSIIRILDGQYEMGVGSGPADTEAHPPIVCRMEAGPGFVYEMPHQEGWHYVRPRDGKPTWSLMIMGDGWRQRPGIADHLTCESLTEGESDEMFAKFGLLYPANA